MTIDNEFVAQFEAQIGLLENMEKAVKEAIGKARDDLKLLKANPGKNIEDVIPPDPPKK
jgi:cyanate lyase